MVNCKLRAMVDIVVVESCDFASMVMAGDSLVRGHSDILVKVMVGMSLRDGMLGYFVIIKYNMKSNMVS